MTAISKETATGQTAFAASFNGNELVQILAPLEVLGQVGPGCGAISTDTRSLRPGQWYLALKGENFDGHQFIHAAIECGAAGCIVSEFSAATKRPESVVIIKVKDTLSAYHAIATHWLGVVKPFVIGVTGSSGKTTTKEMCAAVLSSVKSHKSKANENNEIGLPKTILSMPPDTKVLVAEMGMRGLGQIALLAQTAKPDAAIITGVGTAHIELLGSVENIIKAKCEIFENLRNDGVAIIGAPTEPLVERTKEVFQGRIAMFDRQVVRETDVDMQRTQFEIDGRHCQFTVHAHGLRHLQDAWCAVMAGRAAGLSDEDIAKGLDTYRSVEGRGNRLSMASGNVVIDESYNANPDSIKCAVEAVLDQRAFPQKNKYIILGEMAELGDNSELMHQQTGAWLKDKEFTALLTVGEKASVIAKSAKGGSFEVIECPDQDVALTKIKEFMDVPNSCVMVKGSHCANLDKLVASLMQTT